MAGGAAGRTIGGLAHEPTLNPIALFLRYKHGGLVHVEDGRVRFADATRKHTLPYMGRFLCAVGGVYGGPISSDAVHLLDEVLAGAYDEPPASEEQGTP